jgi:MFS family permease
MRTLAVAALCDDAATRFPGLLDDRGSVGVISRRSAVGSRWEIVAQRASTEQGSSNLGRVLAPLALAQFICSFAGTNMNVMITDISEDLDTTVEGVQIAITIFLLVMAALMIPGGKLTDRYGRKRCFMVGLVVYGVGALVSALSPGLGVLIIGNSILEGIGTALLIPPVYILTTLLFTEVTSRARAFGVISASGGIGAAAGPLIGGLITSAISWRAAFIFQALVIAIIVLLSRKIKDPLPPDPSRSFDTGGAVLSAIGLVLLVMGILAADNNIWLMVILIVAGALVLLVFFRSVHAKEKAGKEPLLSTGLFRNRTSNLGLVTQNTQWLMLMGTSFVVSAYLQVVRGYNAIETGIIFTAATLGLLVSSLAAARLAKRYAQRTLILAGFVLTIAGVGVLLLLVSGSPTAWAFAPGLLLIGLGLGAMLTPSVNVVQSSFPERQQGEISGLSRSVSNLGSCLGTAVAGTILVAGITATPGRAYGLAMTALAVVGVIGLVATVMLPSQLRAATAQDVPQQDGPGDRGGVADTGS